MKLEYQLTIVVECDENKKKETVGRLTQRDFTSLQVIKKTTTIRNKETGEQYLYASS